MKCKIISLLKILTSLSLIFFCFTLVDYTSVFKIIYNQSKIIIITTSILIFFTLILGAYRWKIICKDLKIQISFKQILSISLFSNFIGQILPGGGLSGEITKVLLSNSKTSSKYEILKSVVCDKLFGLTVAFFFFIISLICVSYLLFDIINKRIFYFFCFTFIVSIILILIFKKQFVNFLKRKNYNLLFFKRNCLYNSIIISLLIYFLVFFSYLLVCFENISNEKLFKIILCFPIIHFLKSFPISISGWGIREIVTIYLFSNFDIPNEVALSISISLGVIILVSSFYGLVLSFPIYLKKKNLLRINL